MRIAPAAALLLALAAGCAPHQAFYRPEGARAVGRDGYVGAACRLPPGAPDREAEAVTALAPATAERAPDGGLVWRLTALIELRNKRQEAVVFLPDSVRLAAADGPGRAPDRLTRTGRAEALSAPVEVPHWHQASFQAAWLLPGEEGRQPPRPPLRLSWEYRYGGATHRQELAYAGANSELARRSLSGDPEGLVTETSFRSASGVPFLMNVPFVGALFRSGTEVRSSSRTTFGTAPSSGGTWWPLEP